MFKILVVTRQEHELRVKIGEVVYSVDFFDVVNTDKLGISVSANFPENEHEPIKTVDVFVAKDLKVTVDSAAVVRGD